MIDAYRNDAQMNGLKFDSHTEEKAVELFAANIMKAGEAFYQNQWTHLLFQHGVELSAIHTDFLIRLSQ